MDSLVLQTVIGLVFVFATFAALVTVLTESVARVIGLRGEYLLRGVRSLLDGHSHFSLGLRDLLRRKKVAPEPKTVEPVVPWVVKLMEHPLISGTADHGAMPANAGNTKLTAHQRRKLPSYLASRSFAMAMISEMVPGRTAPITMDDVTTVVKDLPDGHLKTSMLALTDAAGAELDTFRKLLEQWYDDHMARVSGWYKRHVRWVSLGIATLLVLAFNLSAIQITRSLYTDQVLSGSVVTTATDAAQCQDKDPATCLQDLRAEIEQVRGAGLPIGWSEPPECQLGAHCGWLSEHGLADPVRGGVHDVLFLLLVLVGWSIMVVAILPGARFWFDALSRLGSLRSAGPKPVTT
jgi:hypothetical protein